MPWAPLRIAPGLSRLSTPYDAPNCWYDANTVRWLSGALYPIGGNTRITSSPASGMIRKLFEWRDNNGAAWVAVGREDGVSVLFGSALTDVTPAAFVPIPATGSGGGFGTGLYGTDASPVTDPSGTTINKSQTITVTIASPAVVTWTAHGLTVDDVVKFTTTGALPTGITAGTAYYVIPIDADTFKICSIGGGKNGTPINTSGTQSGTHTGSQIVGQDTYGRQRSVNPLQYRHPYFWTFDNYGQDCVGVCSSDGRLLYFTWTSGTPAAMTVPSNAPTGNVAVAVTHERAVMLMGAGGNPRRVAWSDIEDVNGWNFSSLTGQAGFIDLECKSPIITGFRVREGVLVLTEHDAWLLRYVGAPYFYGAEPLGQVSLISGMAVCVGANQAVWMGEESFWRYDGSAARPLPCPFFGDIKNALDPLVGVHRCHMHENGVFPEVWFEFPSAGQTECDSYIIWSWAEGWWTRGKRSRTASCGAQAGTYPLAASVDKYLFQHEDGWTDNGASRVGNIWAETSILELGSNNQVYDINQALVAFDPEMPAANLQIKLLSRFTPGIVETTYGPYTPRADGYTDTRAAGRDFRLRIEATADGYWSVGQVRLALASGGGDR